MILKTIHRYFLIVKYKFNYFRYNLFILSTNLITNGINFIK